MKASKFMMSLSAAVAKILRPLVRNMSFFGQNPNFILHCFIPFSNVFIDYG